MSKEDGSAKPRRMTLMELFRMLSPEDPSVPKALFEERERTPEEWRLELECKAAIGPIDE